MKKIAVFICNAQDTLNCNCSNQYEIDKNYMELPEILELIRIKTNSDKLLFSLICGARESTLIEGINKISPYFEGTHIELDNQYSLRHGFNSDGDTILSFVDPEKTHRIEKIIYHIKLLLEQYNITWIGFADDVYCKFPEAKRKLHEKFPNIEIQTFCPNEINSLNNSLINYLGIDMKTIDEFLPNESEWLESNCQKNKVKSVTKS